MEFTVGDGRLRPPIFPFNRRRAYTVILLNKVTLLKQCMTLVSNLIFFTMFNLWSVFLKQR